MCVAAFPKATQLFRDGRFHKVRNWMNMNRSIIFEIFGNLKLPGEVGSSDWKIISWKKKIWKMSTFPFMVFAFSFYICSLSVYEKEKDREEMLPAVCLYVCPCLLGWFLHFTMDFINGLLMLSALAILEKKVFAICAVSKSLSAISSFSIKASFSLDTIL